MTLEIPWLYKHNAPESHYCTRFRLGRVRIWMKLHGAHNQSAVRLRTSFSSLRRSLDTIFLMDTKMFYWCGNWISKLRMPIFLAPLIDWIKLPLALFGLAIVCLPCRLLFSLRT